MIFRTKNEWGNSGIINGVSGIKSLFSDIKDNYFSSQQRFSADDTKAINNYIAEIERLKSLQKTTANFNGTIKESIIQKQAFNNTMQNSSKGAQKFVKGLQDGTNNLNQMTKASKAAELGMKALSMAGNMIAMWAIGEAISFAIKELDNFFNAADKAIEKGKNALSEIQSLNKEVKDTNEAIEANKDKYAEYSKGVSAAGENVSLTAEQFKEYHDITNQIAEKFPSLINGFDSEGNAILKN